MGSSECVAGLDEPTRWFVFTHSSAYRRSQRELDDAVEVGNPALLQELVQRHPCQVDALLRLGEFCGKTGQLELAAELTERALYYCEQALHPMCKLLDGTARLSFAEPANQPFFLALFRHMIGCGRRGCARTALEIGRLLLSLDPDRDPMHVLLHLDYYALRSASASTEPAVEALQWLLQLPQQLPQHSLSLYPNIAFSLALTHRRLLEHLMHGNRSMNTSAADDALQRAREQEAELNARQQLRRALLLFPAALPLLVRSIHEAAETGIRNFQQLRRGE